MDNLDNPRPKSVQLTARQQVLVEELGRLSQTPNLAGMLVGACQTLQDRSNPEVFPQAAHSLRELMEKLEGIKGIPITDKAVAEAKGTLGDKCRQLRARWLAAVKKSKCLADQNPADEIDAPLRKLLNEVKDFFGWMDNNQKLSAGKPIRLVKGLDPLAASLPQDVQEAQAAEWSARREYFQKVSHHGRVATAAEFEATLAALEIFLHGRLAPVKAENQRALQDLIKEVES